MKILWLFLAALAPLACSFAQQPNNTLPIAVIDSIRDTLFKQANYQQALPYAQLSVEKNKKTTPDSIYGKSLSHLAVIYRGLGDYEKSKRLVLEVAGIYKQLFGVQHDKYANILNTLGAIEIDLGNYEEAELAYKESMEVYKNLYGTDNLEYSKVLNGLGALYSKISRYEEAEQLLKEALAIRQHLLGENHLACAATLNNLGVIYWSNRQYDKAIDSYKKVCDIRKKILGENHPNSNAALNNLAIAYKDIRDFANAEKCYQTIIAQRLQQLGKQHPSYADAINNLGVMYYHQHKLDKALALYKEALEIRKIALGEQHPEYAMSLNNVSLIYKEQHQYKLALEYNLQALRILSNLPNLSSEINEQWAKELLGSPDATNTLGIFSNLFNLVQLDSSTTQQTEKAYLVTQVYLKLNEKLRNEFITESDKFRNLNAINELVSSAIVWGQACGKLHPEQKQVYDNEAFTFAEDNKYVLLSQALQSERARSLGNLPDSLVQLELQLQASADKIKKQKLEARDSLAKHQINAHLNEINLQINDFQAKIKKEYPAYHQLKYAHSTSNAASIQQLLQPKTALLEYFLSDKACFVFCLTTKGLKIYSLNIDKDTFKEQVGILRECLSNYNLIREKSEQVFEQFVSSSSYFYKHFIAPVRQDLEGIEQLIIVPDHLLGHLPFEVFLVETPQGKSYNKLHYLVKNFAISYSYSASLLQENYQTKTRKGNGKLLAVAPKYQSKTDLLNHRSIKQQLLRKNLSELPAAEQEVQKVAAQFDSEVLLGAAANEKTFKNTAGAYSVIHLAMHGLLDSKHPILSSLAFTENGDSTEDNFLQAFEISKLQLNAELVVLSACETGFGKFQQGEGVMSLGRAFMYTGVPSLVMSLWAVNDQSTAIIMESFYTNLSKGMDKAVALRQAKLSYLQNSAGIAAHPAFWSAFVQLGNTQAISIQRAGTTPYWVWGIGAGIAMIAGLAGFWAWRNRKQ